MRELLNNTSLFVSQLYQDKALALVIWSSLQLTSNSKLIYNNSLLELIYFFSTSKPPKTIPYVLASCVIADVSKGWRILPQLILCLFKLSIVFWHIRTLQNTNELHLFTLQQIVNTSLKMEVTHLCSGGLCHQFSPIILPVKNKAPLVLLRYWNNLKL